jgi:predicted MFS family arabinose efflux permease
VSGETEVAPPGEAGPRSGSALANGSDRTRVRPAASADFSRRGRRAALAMLLAVTMGMALAPSMAVGVLSRFVIDDLGLARGDIGLMSGVMSGVATLAAVWVGRATDRIGGRVSLIWVLGLSLIATCAVAAAPTYGFLLGAAAIAGLALSGSNPATNRLVVEHLPAGRRGLITGVKQAGETAAIVAVGAALPSIGLAMGWRWAIGLMAVVPGFALIAAVVTLPRDVVPSRGGDGRRPADVPGSKVSWAWWLATYSLFMAMAGGSVSIYLPLYSQEAAGMSVTTAGLVMVVAGLAAMAGRVLWSHLTERARSFQRSLGATGLLSAAALLLIWAGSLWGTAPVWAGGVLWGASGLSCGSLIMLTIVAAPEEGAAGRASGVVILGFSAGFAIGPPLFGALVDATGGYDVALGIGVSFFLVAAVVVGLWRRIGGPVA